MAYDYLLPLLVFVVPFLAPLMMRDLFSFVPLIIVAVASVAWFASDPGFSAFRGSPVGAIVVTWSIAAFCAGAAVRAVQMLAFANDAMASNVIAVCGFLLPVVILFGAAEFARVEHRAAERGLPGLMFPNPSPQPS